MRKKKNEKIAGLKWSNVTFVLTAVLAVTVAYGIYPRAKGNEDEVETKSALFYGVTPDPSRITEYFTCSRVIDGDTFEAVDSKETITVRLIGVDTPESVAPEESGKTNTEEGKTASEYTAELLTGKTVYLEFDEERYDQYGRTLAYVYLDQEGDFFVNGNLIEGGLARCMEISPNDRYADYFEFLEDNARESDAGFWGTGFFTE